MTKRPGDLPSYRYGMPTVKTASDRAYDAAVNKEGLERSVGFAELEEEFTPENAVRDYGRFTLNLSVIDKRLVNTTKPVIPWLDVRNMMLDGMQIDAQPEAPIEVKWTTLLNYVAQHVPQGTMPAQSELHGKAPVGGLAEMLITGLGLQAYEGVLNGTLIEAEGFAFGDKDERYLLAGELGSSRERLIAEPEHGRAHERSREARLLTRHLSAAPADQNTENPYRRIEMLRRQIREDVPNPPPVRSR